MVQAEEMSAHAAMIDDQTMSAKETSVRPVTMPWNMMTSPYAIRMMVRFLKILQSAQTRARSHV